jgi:hypothetical protein
MLALRRSVATERMALTAALMAPARSKKLAGQPWHKAGHDGEVAVSANFDSGY